MPQWPLDDRYELLLDGDWVDVTEYVYDRDAVTITRGRSAEAQEADPAQMTLTLDNRDGRFSPRNPTSPYYGVLGRNTQIRASLPYGSSYLRVQSGDVSHVTCPDSASLDITGDIDIRVEVDADQWRAGDLAAKYEATGDQRSWWLGVEGGLPELLWSPDGTLASRLSAFATEPMPVQRGRKALRVTLDVDDGASGYTVTFYTADTIAGPWTQLGDPVTGSGTTSIFGGTAGLEVGGAADLAIAGSTGGVSAIEGRYLAFELRDGIDGTLVASPDFSAQAPGTTSFDDAQGNTWTVEAGAAIDDRRYRFHGEVASWPATWRMGGHDAYVQITASGVKRRLTQNAPVIGSPMFRQFAYGVDHVVAYWPMEDAEEATQVAAAHAGTPPMTIVGAPAMAGYQDWTASDPVPVAETGLFTGFVPAYAPTGQISVRMFVYVTELPAAESSLLRVDTTGTARSWDIRLDADGNLRTRCFDSAGTSILDSLIAFNMHTRGFCFLRLELTQNGSNIDWRTAVADFDNRDTIHDSIPVFSDSGTVTSKTVGNASRVMVNRDQTLGKTVVGHVVVADDVPSQQFAFDGIAAYNGENPGNRMERLCEEEEVSFALVTKGQVGNYVTLGDQLNRPLMELLQEAADTDGGILFEPRDFLGFAYRTRISMYNQAPAVVLDCGGRQVTGDLTPVDDDRFTLNDLTVKREHGSSVRVEETEGPLSTAEPPAGVGRYSGEVTVSLERDEYLLDHAGWRLHLGTVDEARFPTLTVNLRSTGITDQLYEQIMELDVGDRIVLTGIPDGLPPDDVSLLVEGYTEQMRRMGHVIEFNLRPESPWHVGQVETEGYDRVDTAGSELADGATSTATELLVATTEGPVWTSDPDDLPFDVMVAGERVTVTAVDGSAGHVTGFKAADSFGRTETAGWGTADTGQEWSTFGGSASHYTTDGSVGSISVNALSSGRYSLLAQPHTDADLRVDIRCPTAPTGDATNGYLLARATQNGATWYAATAGFAEDGNLYLALERQVSGSFAFVVSPTDTGITFDTGTWYTLRFQVVGTALRVKVWERGTDEPADWFLEASDSNLAAGEALACRAYVEPGSTVTLPVSVLFDNFYGSVVQSFTVTRSVNGVVKALPPGSSVSIAEPVYIAL